MDRTTKPDVTEAQNTAAWRFLGEIAEHGNTRPAEYIDRLSVWHSLDPDYSLAPGYPQRLRDHLNAELYEGRPLSRAEGERLVARMTIPYNVAPEDYRGEAQ